MYSEDSVKRDRLYGAVVAAFVVLFSSQCLAQKNYFVIPDAELRLLPPFCRTGFSSYGIQQSEAIYLNHLCPGLYALNDAQRTFGNDGARQFALHEAVDHLNYTLNATSKTLALRPIILVKRGTALEMQGERAKAIADYQAAIALAPKNLYGYVSLCNAYVKIGDKKSALDVADKGLKISPTSKALLNCRAKVNGA